MTSNLHVAFRADASLQIGTGHIARCLTLADSMKKQGIITQFICRHLPEYTANLIQDSGHKLTTLSGQEETAQQEDLTHSHWLGVSQQFDANQSLKCIKTEHSWIVVDHYALDHRWESHLKDAGHKILVIDDLSDRLHNCDMFLNQNLVEQPEKHSKTLLNKACKQLIGPQYALLRDEFLNAKPTCHIRNKLERILIFFGGSDADNNTEKAIHAIMQLPQAPKVDVVIGSLHPCKKQIQQLCAQNSFHCHIQSSEMARLMSQADLAIGASGSACWERCALGLPSILLSIADNQTPIAEALSHAKAALYLGLHKRVSVDDIRQTIQVLSQDSQHLSALSETCFSLTDGLGKHRIIEQMRALS